MTAFPFDDQKVVFVPADGDGEINFEVGRDMVHDLEVKEELCGAARDRFCDFDRNAGGARAGCVMMEFGVGFARVPFKHAGAGGFASMAKTGMKLWDRW